MTKKPRCGKLLPKLQVTCDRSAGHTGWCQRIDRERKAVTKAAWNAANPERKAAYDAAWKKANPERRAVTKAAWNAANPERKAAYDAAWAAANPERRAATNAAWAAANPERKAAADAAWAKNNPERKKAQKQKRRAVKAGATTEPFTKAELKARMASFGDACYYCALLGIVGPYECEDHVFPLEPRKGHKRGPHALRNLVPSCTKHNSEKHNKPPMEFITKLLLVG